jgi:hypothetical protein
VAHGRARPALPGRRGTRNCAVYEDEARARPRSSTRAGGDGAGAGVAGTQILLTHARVCNSGKAASACFIMPIWIASQSERIDRSFLVIFEREAVAYRSAWETTEISFLSPLRDPSDACYAGTRNGNGAHRFAVKAKSEAEISGYMHMYIICGRFRLARATGSCQNTLLKICPDKAGNSGDCSELRVQEWNGLATSGELQTHGKTSGNKGHGKTKTNSRTEC